MNKTRLVAYLSIVLILVSPLSACRQAPDPCEQEKSFAWMDQTRQIRDKFDVQEITAEQAYRQQLTHVPPDVLSHDQDLTLQFYYNAWQADEAEKSGDSSAAQDFMQKSSDAMKQAATELDRVAAQCGWERK